MRYGRDYNVTMLTDVQQEVCIVLIAREITSPSASMAGIGRGGRGTLPDDPIVRETAKRIFAYPEGSRDVALRADCIHASFGIADFITEIGGPSQLEAGSLGYRRKAARIK